MGAGKLSIEIRAAAISAAIAVVVLGLVFGVSYLVRAGTSSSVASAPAPASSLPAGAAATQNGTASSAAIASGKSAFADGCASCHGDGGSGGYAPDLHKIQLDTARIAAVIRSGVPGKMPAFGNRLKPDAIQNIAVYAVSLQGH